MNVDGMHDPMAGVAVAVMGLFSKEGPGKMREEAMKQSRLEREAAERKARNVIDAWSGFLLGSMDLKPIQTQEEGPPDAGVAQNGGTQWHIPFRIIISRSA